MDGLEWKTLLKLMIWGYHYFWKHPYCAVHSKISNWSPCLIWQHQGSASQLEKTGQNRDPSFSFLRRWTNIPLEHTPDPKKPTCLLKGILSDLAFYSISGGMFQGSVGSKKTTDEAQGSGPKQPWECQVRKSWRFVRQKDGVCGHPPWNEHSNSPWK